MSGPGEGGGLAEVIAAHRGCHENDVARAVHTWLSSDKGMLADEVVDAAAELAVVSRDRVRIILAAALSVLPVDG